MKTVRWVLVWVLVCGMSMAQQPPAPAPPKKQPQRKESKTKKVPPQPSASQKNAPQNAEEKPPEPMSAQTFEGLKLRSIGPAMISGRVLAFAVDPNHHQRYYVASASGGVWKTNDDGISWQPVFDHEGSYSIGAIALDPNDPNIVWVGTGESNSQRSVGWGDGVYRSDDGGKSWKNMGLKDSEHIGRIVIDPRNTSVVYVAAEGPLWSAGGDRGLYKTSDGGKTWDKVLSISDVTGVGDVAMDPTDPDVLYAAAYQRQRKVWTLIDGGPEGALYKSTDAGKKWKKLTSGLPKEDLGRIGLGISPADHNTIYATVEAANKAGGIFRSKDAGATWEKRNPFDQQAQYYARVIPDPKNVDRIYVMNFNIMVSEDGGKTLTPLPSKSKHVDNHTIWIDPDDTDHVLVGCDGGVYESYDRGHNWQFKANLPLAQFYDVAVDNASPFYFIYGGTQDNNSVGGPSRTPSASGIINADWFVTQGGDGFKSAVDPEDPNTVYAEYQNGGLTRYDRRTGESTGIQPQELQNWPIYRWDWDSPIVVSPHAHTRIYFGANVLFQSDDRGDNWRVISPDLTRQLDRNQLAVMGKIWGPDAVAKNVSTAFYGNITTISESPLKAGLIFVGTDDGLIQVTEDDGANWRKIENFPGVPERTYVARVSASRHDANTVYAALEHHKEGDYKPYLVKSTDLGRSWKSIAGNLPENGPVLGFAEDPVNPDLLFAGTEFGVFFTVDGGQKWVQLKGGLPTIPVRDVAIQARDGDLDLATFGRGFYILDDIAPLRQLKDDTLNADFVDFPLRDAWLYNEAQPFGDRGKAHLGESFYTGDNPAFGATFTYYLKDKIKTQKEARQEEEKKAEKAGKSAVYPSDEELVKEADELAPEVIVTVSDAAGDPVRRLTGGTGAGMQRVTWDLRYAEPTLVREKKGEGDQDFGGGSRAPLVLPGKYTVSFAKEVAGVITPLGAPQTFTVKNLAGQPVNADDREALIKFQKQVAELYRALNGTIETAKHAKDRIADLKLALLQAPQAQPALVERAGALEAQNREILRQLVGNEALGARNEPAPVDIRSRVDTILFEQSVSSSRPTGTNLEQYKVASAQLTEQLGKLRQLIQTDLAKLEQEAEAAGAPWTAGRLPVWPQK